MITTEAEAREKGCPLVLIPTGSAAPQTHTKCIASDCMAWRWAPAPYADKVTIKIPPDQSEATDRKGYCGAFGTP